METLKEVACKMVRQAGKGILAADESTKTIMKRFASVDVEPSFENRNHYRCSLFTSKGIEDFISGVILYDETARLKADEAFCNGKTVIEHLKDLGIVPGIKVDKGTKPLTNKLRHHMYTGYKITEGLDGLRERLSDYKQMGLQFTKWRAVIDGMNSLSAPETYSIKANAHALARYAVMSQEEGLVPIVEPEIILENTASLDMARGVTSLTLKIVFNELYEQGVDFSEMVLKPNMVMKGYNLGSDEPDKVALETLSVLADTVPVSVPGIAFLSGGQSDQTATANLAAINLYEKGFYPWSLTFSYGRALQSKALKEWAKWRKETPELKEPCEAAQNCFIHRAKANSAAISGCYSSAWE